MEEHKKTFALEDSNGKELVEVGYCTRSHKGLIRARAWQHLGEEELESLIGQLTFILNHKVKKAKEGA